ncbi:hypothetical protein F2Q68_00034405 [Brassica cretica]|uniref:Uncharacterized protein n=2 Tax=Brassica cretica TaxID=69181 RepID=A0A8S9GYF6_BRACR|nr:hypothetical protein F2Q68_00034405 [Brassica cretica]KAF3490468.1 hypothetical protein F2Q69_00053197 [Brassica cretica]KAF3593284.1 hypothetical protein DY000_02022214 [Brassica cretica]
MASLFFYRGRLDRGEVTSKVVSNYSNRNCSLQVYSGRDICDRSNRATMVSKRSRVAFQEYALHLIWWYKFEMDFLVVSKQYR